MQFAPCLRQLHPRHLTERWNRVPNRRSREKSSRSFPHDKKFCASMPNGSGFQEIFSFNWQRAQQNGRIPRKLVINPLLGEQQF